jgi:hypothetical protein
MKARGTLSPLIRSITENTAVQGSAMTRNKLHTGIDIKRSRMS